MDRATGEVVVGTLQGRRLHQWQPPFPPTSLLLTTAEEVLLTGRLSPYLHRYALDGRATGALDLRQFIQGQTSCGVLRTLRGRVGTFDGKKPSVESWTSSPTLTHDGDAVRVGWLTQGQAFMTDEDGDRWVVSRYHVRHTLALQ